MSEAQSDPARSRPVYLLAPANADSGGFALAGRDPIVLHDHAELAGRAGGVLLLHTGLPDAQLIGALRDAATLPGPWLAVLLDMSGPEPIATPISLGWPTSAAEIARWADAAPDANVLELRHVLARIARARHDVNNPLTSAMAEAQLALADATEPEIRTGLAVIEEQLKRIRDLIASLKVFRAP